MVKIGKEKIVFYLSISLNVIFVITSIVLISNGFGNTKIYKDLIKKNNAEIKLIESKNKVLRKTNTEIKIEKLKWVAITDSLVKDNSKLSEQRKKIENYYEEVVNGSNFSFNELDSIFTVQKNNSSRL